MLYNPNNAIPIELKIKTLLDPNNTWQISTVFQSYFRDSCAKIPGKFSNGHYFRFFRFKFNYILDGLIGKDNLKLSNDQLPLVNSNLFTSNSTPSIYYQKTSLETILLQDSTNPPDPGPSRNQPPKSHDNESQKQHRDYSS